MENNQNSCKTAAVINLLGKGAVEKPVQAGLEAQVRDIEVITTEILEAQKNGRRSHFDHWPRID